MGIFLKREEALLKIENRIKYLNNERNKNLEFIGFKNNEWKGPEFTIVLIRCNIHNSIKEVRYRNFLRDRGTSDSYCDTCISIKNQNSPLAKFKTKEEALIEINKKVNEINSRGYNVEFLGFVDNKFFLNMEKTHVIIKCIIHNSIQKPNLKRFLYDDSFCIRCKNVDKFLHTNKQIYEYLTSLNLGYDFSPILNEPELGSQPDRKITAICSKHGKFTKCLGTFKHKNLKYPHCDECRREIQKQELKDLTEEKSKLVIEALKNRSEADIEFLGFVGDFYNGNTTLLKLKCNKCGYYWETTDYLGVVGKSSSVNGCPSCAIRKSQSEERCFSIIKEKLVEDEIERSHYLDWKDKTGKKRRMFPDFYISKLNMIIEYNGRQHYEYEEYYHKTYKDFELQVERDQYLIKYCSENNIKLLMIPYLDNDRLEEIILKFLETGEDISTPLEPKI